MHEPLRSRPRWVVPALVLYVVVIGVVVISPVSYSDVVIAIWDWLREALNLSFFGAGWVEFTANVLLFIPLGLLLTLLFRHPWIGVALAVVLSIGAEVAQIVLPSRVPSIRDVIANALGAGIGALLAWAFIAARRRRERQKATTRAR